ncbi:unnamed protein product [Fraxinus pennsylvanica]|uniref:Uncharacterized protein n=1 Tax=Fraxinus pennsylvanica TaxID=56036 RepID=A0AAD1ZTS0_9LAMI|nr:unnamed protein product [Fraxinus pennsylvanica]
MESLLTGRDLMGTTQTLVLDGIEYATIYADPVQGSFHYGSISVIDVYVPKSLPPTLIDGKLRATYNGISFVNPETLIKLADVYEVKGAYKLDFPSKPLDRPPKMDRSVIQGIHRNHLAKQ